MATSFISHSYKHRVVHGFLQEGKFIHGKMKLVNGKKKKQAKKKERNIIIIFATYLPDTYVHDYVINGECRMGKIFIQFCKTGENFDNLILEYFFFLFLLKLRKTSIRFDFILKL